MVAQQHASGHQPLAALFREALSRFRASGAPLEVVCTLPPSRDRGPLVRLPGPAPPGVPVRSLLVLDSSFNPPTRAHLRMARDAVQAYGADGSRILLLLSTSNADKAARPAPMEQRLAMMFAWAGGLLSGLDVADEALRGADTPAVVNVDIGLTIHPFFHDKSAAIASSAFYESPAPLPAPVQVILVGYDTLVRIFNPKYYQEDPGPAQTPMQAALSPFFGRARLRVTGRADDQWGGEADQEAYWDGLFRGSKLEEVGGRREWASRVERAGGGDAGKAVVSSTLAREAAKQKNWEALRRLVGDEVTGWIQTEGLFAEVSDVAAG